MGKVSIITGGSRGIGEAMALKLGEEGYKSYEFLAYDTSYTSLYD